MNYFISGDWGTTHLRLRVVDDRQQVVGEVRSSEGIAATFRRWQESGLGEAGGLGQENRLGFYRAVLAAGIAQLQAQVSFTLQGLRLVLSGMASSSLGMMELPYQVVPVAISGADLIRVGIPAAGEFDHAVTLVSGVRTLDDVMRGEETQLIGCVMRGDGSGGASGDVANDAGRIYLFPGTHSKHVRVKEGKLVDFYTYMTGEFFQLLSTKSILADSVADGAPSLAGSPIPAAFLQGVEDSRHASLLHSAFRVRTNQLFGRYSRDENYSYLSGLLIGSELGTLADGDVPLTIVGAGRLIEYYLAAGHQLGMTGIAEADADRALVSGHCQLLRFG